ncbi:glycosyltransferase family 2 protein [Fusobacterium sp. SYSU M8D902]|uniref:glycosyltransferase family 2 protein n=1 Tax=Fusobacterium sp. SYSU M8D902 TaxID=3159562 RepID=UPI0032E50C20
MKKIQKELVSIITPMYNSEKYILETYNSIKNQTYTKWEWIIIDDNSSDNSYKKILNLSKSDTRIKIIQNLQNLKAAKTRNKGLNIATGEYITFIDSDDLWKDNFLERQLKLIKEKKCNVVYASYQKKNEDLTEVLGEYIVPKRVNYKELLKTNYMSCLTVLYKTEEFKQLRFNENLKMHEDYVMWLELLKENIAYANQDILATYRIRKGSVSRNKLKNLLYMYFIFRKIINLSMVDTFFYLGNYIYYGLKKNKKIVMKYWK